MTLTVRLDDTLQAALDRYCLDTGATKSLVVQESLAVYLLGRPVTGSSKPADKPGRAQAATPPPSRNFQAFAAAGLVGAVAAGPGADKAAVRARMAAALVRRKA